MLVASLIPDNMDSNLADLFLPLSGFSAGLNLLIAGGFLLMWRSQLKQIRSLKATKPDMNRFEALKTKVLSTINALVK